MSDSTRARRFSLPDLADQRVDEAISSFLTGPEQRRGRPGPAAPPESPVNPFAALETRIAWLEAFRRETARSSRYRRPSAVMVIAAEPTAETPEAAAWLGRVAAPIAHVVRRGIRETDLVTRTGDARFQVLLPETTGREASHIAERVIADCEVWLRAVQAPVRLRCSSAGTTAHASLEAALERAVLALEGRPA
ncbi:MAG: diguanylate cyclase [Chloroflexota bacterium]|nr:MAG: diguanylate cyclase [Chloroflexota bacterium]